MEKEKMIRARLNLQTYNCFKIIIKKKNTKIQKVIEEMINNYILNNIELLVEKNK